MNFKCSAVISSHLEAHILFPSSPCLIFIFKIVLKEFEILYKWWSLSSLLLFRTILYFYSALLIFSKQNHSFRTKKLFLGSVQLSVISPFERLRQEDQEFRVSLHYIVRACLKPNKWIKCSWGKLMLRKFQMICSKSHSQWEVDLGLDSALQCLYHSIQANCK
jgi:hypothetical protein